MKVVVNASFLTQSITGAQRFAIELSLGLKNLMPNLIFVTPNNIVQNEIAEKLDVKVIGLNKNKVLWEQIDLPLYLSKQDTPLLINLCNTAPLFYSNHVVAILDLSFFLHKEWFSWVFSTFYNFIVPKVARKARRVITISENTQNDLIRYYQLPSEKIDIVYPSVAEKFLHPINTTYTNKYGEYILAVSSLDPRKNFYRLIQAFKCCQLTDVKLVIVGAANSLFANTEIKDLVADDPTIVFTGYVSDEELIGLYKNALFFAYPSIFEGFGIPPLEAMACGCATLVSNTTSLPEVCGDASVYVDPHSVDAISDAINSLVADKTLRKELIRKGYERLPLFEKDRSIQKMASIIQQLMNSPIS